MAEFNGNNLGMAVLFRDIAELRTEARYTNEALRNQNAILLELPSKIASAISTPQTFSSPKPRILPELSELIRALYPVLILCGAVLGKSALPAQLPMIRVVLQAILGDGS